ncbi:MAG: tetratricopeptide repeat protein, partial [Pirellulaceae bacterium]
MDNLAGVSPGMGPETAQAMPLGPPVTTASIERVLPPVRAQHLAGPLSEVEKLSRTILATQPQNPQAHYNLGMLALEKGQPEASLPHFQIAWEADPAQGQYWLSFIAALIQANHLDEAGQVLTVGRQHGLVGPAVDRLEMALLCRQESENDNGVTAHGAQTGGVNAAFPQTTRHPSGPSASRKAKAGKRGKPTRRRHLLVPTRRTAEFPSSADKEAVVRLFNAGRLQEAELAAQDLTRRFPNDGFAWKVLGTVLAQQGQSQAAWHALQKAIGLNPHDGETHNTLGVVLKELGRMDEAVVSYQQAVTIQPDYAEAHYNLGNVWQDMGRLEEAEKSYHRALTIQPNYAEVHRNLGHVLKARSRLEEAARAYRRVLALQPDCAEAHHILGNVLTDVGRVEEAIASYQRAVAIQPDYAEAHYNLGNALKDLGRMDEAVAGYQRALEIKPDHANARSNLSNALKDLGRLDEALAGYRKALEIKPDDLAYRSNLLFLHAFARVGSFQQEYDEARKWEQMALSGAERQAARDRTFEIPTRQGRPLRLGIVSAELGQHAVAHFLQSFLGAIDRKRLTVLLYPTVARPAGETAPLRALADGWSSLCDRSDAEAAAHIRADAVDILLDTTGHTQNCRLGIFAHRAAPVQCHYIGYAGTTGLTEMDYYLADPVLIPEELDEYFQETVWRLSRPWVAYAPRDESPDPVWQPAKDGRIRLGSFNNLNKLSDSCLSLWARVLRALPDATLLLKDNMALDTAIQRRIFAAFAQLGVERDRVTFLPRVRDWRQHMALYNQLDIALDTIPFGSGTTGFDAAWMGVPLITLAGAWMGGRMGAAMLTGLGHPEWIAQTADEYVAKVVSLGRAETLRAQLRSTQRARMQEGPLCDGRGLAIALQDAFEAMFDKWWTRNHTPSRRTVEAPTSAEREAVVRLFHTGRLSEAELAARELTRRFPDDGPAWKALGTVLARLGQSQAAWHALQTAIGLVQSDAETHNTAGVVLKELGRLDEAVTHYQRAVTIQPDYAEAHYNLGNVFRDVGRLDESLASYRQALKIKPDYADAHYNLGNTLADVGRPDEALTSYQQALEIKPDNLAYRSNLLFLYAFARVGSFQQEYAEARKWEQVALSDRERQTARLRTFGNPARQGRPLRLGIVSGELGQHAVANFLTAFLDAVDRTRLTVLLYPTTLRRAAETEPLRALADGWSPLFSRTDAEAAAQIRADTVDILLDTTGHTLGCRLGIFAHRAAPVQCHYIGYAGTTGLTEMDYFLADRVLVPKTLDDHFQEQVWRLPRPWVAYAPLKEAPDPAWHPAHDGRIRLGSFNNLNKLSDSCLSLWARILREIPEATLLLKDKMAQDRAVQARILRTLAGLGVAADRVTFLPRAADWRQHMAMYDQLDIALDTIPFGSGTTGFDALWMGVPLITLAGSWLGGRMGAAMLTGMGHPEWIANTEEEYVAKVASLGRNGTLRTRLRSTQRERMRKSPLCDGPGMARALEDAFEAMFDIWWTGQSTPVKSARFARSPELPGGRGRTITPAFDKLHLGCGKRYIPGFFHIDLLAAPHVDLLHRVDSLPFVDNSVGLIYASHLLEHFGRNEVEGVLREWYRVLRPGGLVRLAVPDFAAV